MAKDNPVSPLTEKHYSDITDALSRLDSADKIIDMAKQAGIDVGNAGDVAAGHRQQLLKIKNTFFPGR